MTNHAHTPAPWEWNPVHDDDDDYPVITIMAEPWNNQPGIVQHVAKLASWGKWNDDEVIANANLIAAAPDLLAALLTLTDHAQETYPHFESERGQRDIAAALEAIAKAEGR